MSSVEELTDLLASTKPPKQLLHPMLHAPAYMVDPVTALTGSFHGPPYNAEEQAAIGEAKMVADKSGEQTRADLVFPNLMIGNMYAAQDAQYLANQVAKSIKSMLISLDFPKTKGHTSLISKMTICTTR